MVVCVHLPRFELAVAAGGRSHADREALAGKPLAIAPEPGGPRRVGEVSGAAEAHGVTAGMPLGEALARCPSLQLMPADPLRLQEEWEGTLLCLEGIGAAVEAPSPGLAFFGADGLLRLHLDLARVIEIAGRVVRERTGIAPRIGAGPGRFIALAVALSARPGRGPAMGQACGAMKGARPGAKTGPRSVVVQRRGAKRWLASQPVDLLRFGAQTEALVQPLRRLGLATLGQVAALGADAIADCFGKRGALAHRLASGQDTPLLPRSPVELIEEELELDEADLGLALERILRVLIDRLLANPKRRGRTLRAVTLAARLVEEGTWRERVVFREATADGERIGVALAPRLAMLPAPAEALRLGVACFGPAIGEQVGLLDGDVEARQARLREAVSQARATAGPDAALRIVLVDADSNVPERRVVLSPFEG